MFKISEWRYPVMDYESPKQDIQVHSFIIARWDMGGNYHLPTENDVFTAVYEMQRRFPGRQKDYRIMGLVKPGDRLFGVEVA